MPSEGDIGRDGSTGHGDGGVVGRAGLAGENVRGEVFGGQHTVAAVDHGPLNDVLQLADVAGPGVLEDGVEEAVLDAVDGDAVLGGELDDELLGQRDDVDLPLTERRDLELQHAEAVVQVGAETRLLDQRLQIEVAGHDQPGLRLQGAVRPHRLELAGLDDAQEFDLLLQSEDIDFVEQHRPATGGHELALLVGVGAGE